MRLLHSDRLRELGGPGSGNWGHAGRPGQRGGSQRGSGGIAKPSKQSFNNMRDINKKIKKSFVKYIEQSQSPNEIIITNPSTVSIREKIKNMF